MNIKVAGHVFIGDFDRVCIECIFSIILQSIECISTNHCIPTLKATTWSSSLFFFIKTITC